MDKDKLEAFYTKNLIEAGCDEVGVGCLAGPVVLPKDFDVIFPKILLGILLVDIFFLKKSNIFIYIFKILISQYL